MDRSASALTDLRVGVMAGYAAFCAAATVRAAERIVSILKETGAIVTTVPLPPPEIAVDVYVTTAAAEASSNLRATTGSVMAAVRRGRPLRRR